MHKLFSALCALTLLIAAPAAVAQASQPAGGGGGHQGMGMGQGGQPQIPPDQQKALMLAQMQLMQAQQKAMSDPTLVAARQKVRDLMEAEMLKRDPTLKSTLKRFGELEKEGKVLQAAQQKGTMDPAKAQAWMAEMQKIGPALQKAQASVEGLPNVQKAKQDFEKKLDAKMLEIDPGVPKAKALIEAFNPNKRR